jgi:CSLREA domain-containing protein
MVFIKRYYIFLILLCLATGVLSSHTAFTAGSPHSIQNDIECGNCHWTHTAGGGTLFPEWATPTAQNIDDTVSNNLCRGCHNDSDAPAVETHSSTILGTRYGNWAVECIVCHEPHNQKQVRDYPLNADNYIFYGTSTTVTPTQITQAGAGWKDDEFAGLVLFPDINALWISYKIKGNTADTLTVDDPLNPGFTIDLTTDHTVGDNFIVSYGKLIRAALNTGHILTDPSFPKSGEIKEVKFFRPENAGPGKFNSFSDGDSTYNGICEVCHDYTTHSKYDGLGTDNSHSNVGSPMGDNCLRCHDHRRGFAHGGGRGTKCVYCHGHDTGWFEDEPWLGGRGSFQSHSTHTENDDDDARGPMLDCADCHDTNKFPFFKDGKNLAETTVCDDCHSPEGDYDGINDPNIGAKYGNNGELKYNWKNRIYDDVDNISLKVGNEKWCATCHDKSPSRIDDVDAPNVVGDEEASYTYGTGYGYYKTGHGLPADETYPSKGGIVTLEGRVVECGKCHNTAVAHVDGKARTFDCRDGDNCDHEEYRQSYRLNQVNGFEPMAVPWTEMGTSSASKFRLCTQFGCHDPGPYTDSSNFETNLKMGDPLVNRHSYHLSFFNQIRYPADYDYNSSYNSKINCVTCHNVHGSTRLAMVRDGKLIDREPGLEIWYVNDDLVSYKTNNSYPPDPENLPLAVSTGNIWRGGTSSNLCTHCHGNGNTIPKYRCVDTGHDCPPFQDDVEQPPFLDWTGEAGYLSDGVNPDSGFQATPFNFRVKYTDYNYDVPAPIQVWIDRNDDGDYDDAGEKLDLTEVYDFDTDYSNGKLYQRTVTLSKLPLPSDNKLRYRFYASDGTSPATGAPTEDGSIELFNAIPELAWTGEPYFVSEGVNPNVGGNGANFEFRVSYTDLDDEAPSLIQVWIDRNDDGDYDDTNEKETLTAADGGDTDYTDGKLYSFPTTLSYDGDGQLSYKFHASDGIANATGDPTSDNTVTVMSSSNNPPLVEWYSGTCLTKGVKPALGAAGEDFEFGMTYTDSDGCPSSGIFQVWIDLDGGGYSGSEQHDLVEDDPADTDCTDGKLYKYTSTIPTAGTYNYRFHANDGTDDAFGEATTEHSVEVIDAVVVHDGESIQDVISHDITILVYEGTYNENIKFSTGNGDNSNITLQSVCGPEVTIIQGIFVDVSSTGTVGVQGVSNTVIDGFTLAGGYNGVVLNGSVTVRNLIIENNLRGIYSITTSSRLVMEDTVIRNNSGAVHGAGIFFNSGGPHSISGSDISNNESTAGAGGGIYLQNAGVAGLTIEDTTVSNNTAAGAGGGIWARYSKLDVDKLIVSSNTSGSSGGGLYLGDGAIANMTNSNIVDNTGSQSGGGFFLGNYNSAPIDLNMTNCTVSNNKLTDTTNGLGGGLYNRYSNASITNTIFRGNEAAGFQSAHEAYANLGTGQTFSFAYSDVINTLNNFTVLNGSIDFDPSCIESDPMFVDSDNGDYHLKLYSPAIDQGTSVDAPIDDIDGDCRPDGNCGSDSETWDIGADEYATNAAPLLTWTGEDNYTADGVDPDSGISGSTFSFRIDYSDAENDAPSLIQVWIDEDNDGAYRGDEKFSMTEVDASDTDYVDGKRYSLNKIYTIPGGAVLNFRFYATDGTVDAAGEPTDQQSLIVMNHIPVLSWTGEVNYVSDGVNPESGMAGSTSYEFRIDYTDNDNTPPGSMQVWIDKDDSGAYGESEKYDMVAVDGGDIDYTDGKRYSYTTTLPYTSDGTLNYRFYAFDGADDATGDPTLPLMVTATEDVANTAPTLAWTTADCLTSGVRPPKGSGASDFEFMVNYTSNNQCADTIQVWIDEDDSNSYEEGEKYDLVEDDAGDSDCTDGKLYKVTTALSLAGDNLLNYRFYATDGTDIASGEPVGGSTVTIVHGRTVRPAGSSLPYDFTSVIDAANAVSGTILVYPEDDFTAATYTENVSLNNRDNITIISTCGPDLTTISSASTGHTVTVQDSSNFVIDGFSITGATDAGSLASGFFINRVDSTTATIRNSKVYGNYWGFYINNSDYIPVEIDTVEVYNNSGRGFYLVNDYSKANIVNSEIHSHNVSIDGAAMYANAGSSATISRSIIRDNTSSGEGGAIYSNGGSLTIENSIIADNQGLNGGAIRSNNGPTVSIVNTTFADNTATGLGGVFYTCAPGTISIQNSIFWNNYAGDGSDDGNNFYKVCGSSDNYLTISHSNADLSFPAYSGGSSLTGTSMLTPTQDPLFVNATADDYHIQSGSPCKDAIPAGSFSGPTDDFDDIPRPFDVDYDMGADEYAPSSGDHTIVGEATAVVAENPSINVSMPYSGDANGDNSYSVKYKLSSSGTFIDWGTNPKAHTTSPYTDIITGLTEGETYDVEVTYHDSDGIAGQATQAISSIEMPVYSTTTGTPTAEAASFTSLDITIPYTDDDNENNTYSVYYSPTSATGPWTQWDAYIFHRKSPYTETITDLKKGDTYYVRFIYLDSDGVNGTPEQVIGPVELPDEEWTAPGIAQATAATTSTIAISMPYTQDVNGDNTYTVEYKLSSEPTVWTVWPPNPKAHSASPFIDTITVPTPLETYDVRLTYNDSDGVFGINSQTQTITNISLVPVISGMVYIDEGIIPIEDGTTVRLIVNGSSFATALTNSGAYTFDSSSLSADDAIIVYLDEAVTDGTTVTVYDGDILAGLDIYGDRLIARHDNSGTLTNGLLDTALGLYSDAEILYTVTAGDLTVSATATELFVPTSQSFTPGGGLITTGVDINGTLDGGANDITVSDSWDGTGGVFTSTGTVTFTAASGTKTITPGGTDENHDFHNLIIDDAVGTATFQLGGSLDVNNNLTISDGIFSTSVSNFSVSVAGNFTQTGGQVEGNASTFTISGDFQADGTDSEIGFNNASLVFNGSGSTIVYNALTSWWANGFYNLTVGQGGVTDILSTGLTVRNMLTIGSGELSGAVALGLVGTGDVLSFDAASNLSIDTLMFLNSGGNQNVSGPANGYDCDISIAGDGVTVNQIDSVIVNPGSNLLITGDGNADLGNTYNTAGHPLSVGGNLIIGTGDDTELKTLNGSNSTITVGGDLTLSDVGTGTAPAIFTTTGSTVVLNGTGQSVNGTVTFNNLTKSVTSADVLTFEAGDTITINGTVTFNGAAGQLLTLASSAPGTSTWNFDVDSGATKAIDYVSVSWSDASGSDATQKPIEPTNSTDNGYTRDWFSTPLALTVTTNADTDDGICDASDCSLREAIDAANFTPDNNPINFAPSANGTITISGSAGEDANASGDFDIIYPVTITGNGAANTIISGNNTDRIFHLVSTATGSQISNVLIQNGEAGTLNGGCILSDGSISIINSTVNTCAAQNYGGAIYSAGTTLTDVSISSSYADAAGGSIYNISSELVINGSVNTFTGNYLNNGTQTNDFGGHIWSDTDVTISNSTFTGRGIATLSAYHGGAIYMNGTTHTLNITNSTFDQFYANSIGGAIYMSGGTFTDVDITNSRANAWGGGIANLANPLTINVTSGRNTFSGNYSSTGSGTSDLGGHIYSDGDLNVSDTDFTGRGGTDLDAYRGGAIYMTAGAGHTLTVSDTTFDQFYAANMGGSIYSTGGTLTDISITNSRSGAWGGGIANVGGSLVINGTNTFADNYSSPGTQAGDLGGHIYSNGDLTISNSTFTGRGGTNLDAYRGGAIYMTEGAGHTLTVTDTTFDQFYASNRGGSICSTGGTLTNLSITNSQSGALGGGIANIGGALVINGTNIFYNNYSLIGTGTSDLGGHIYSDGDLTVSNSTFTGRGGTNLDAYWGGAIYMAGGGVHTLTVSDTTFDQFYAYSRGGSIYAAGGTLSNISITNSQAGAWGGAIANVGGALLINGTNTFDNNYSINGTGSGDLGGHIYSNGDLTVSNATFTGRGGTDLDAFWGGAIYMAGGGVYTLTVSDTTFDQFYAYSRGGSIYAAGGTLINISITNSQAGTWGGAIANVGGALVISGTNTFANNYSITGTATSDLGGSIYSNDNLTVSNTTFTGQADTSLDAYYGGAIYMTGATANLNVSTSTFKDYNTNHNGGAIYMQVGTIDRTTFSNNQSNRDGGAVYSAGADVKFINSTFSANTANSDGGAIYSNSSCTIKNSTFYNNDATTTADAIRGNTCTVSNSIITQTTTTTSMCTNTSSGGYNIHHDGDGLDTDNSECFTHATGDSNTDPLVNTTLANNGGPTLTHALQTTPSLSPAIDSGNNTICADTDVNNIDQRGETRPTNGGLSLTCDIGSYEYVP